MELQNIQDKIYEVRGYKVMLDSDLAEMYQTETKYLKRAVRSNITRFPIDFMFELTKDEWETLRCNYCTSNNRGGTRYLPFVFTEQGVAMLASVINSPKAIEVNIQIVRAFVFLRQYALSHKELTEQLKLLEVKYDRQFKDVYDAINYLLKNEKQLEEQNKREKIGFRK